MTVSEGRPSVKNDKRSARRFGFGGNAETSRASADDARAPLSLAGMRARRHDDAAPPRSDIALVSAFDASSGADARSDEGELAPADFFALEDEPVSRADAVKERIGAVRAKAAGALARVRRPRPSGRDGRAAYKRAVLAARKAAAEQEDDAAPKLHAPEPANDKRSFSRPMRADERALSSEASPEDGAAARASRKATAREKSIVRARKRKIAAAACAAAFACVVAVSGALFWNAYLRYDDAADIQGEWQVADGSMTLVIDGESIRMPDSLAYAYTLDTWKKTLSFTFDDLKGSGAYRFSEDRRAIVIKEGEGGNAALLSLVKVSDATDAAPHRGPAGDAAPAHGAQSQESPVDGSDEGAGHE